MINLCFAYACQRDAQSYPELVDPMEEAEKLQIVPREVRYISKIILKWRKRDMRIGLPGEEIRLG